MDDGHEVILFPCIHISYIFPAFKNNIEITVNEIKSSRKLYHLSFRHFRFTTTAEFMSTLKAFVMHATTKCQFKFSLALCTWTILIIIRKIKEEKKL